MLSPEFKEEITSTVEVLETFKISDTVADFKMEAPEDPAVLKAKLDAANKTIEEQKAKIAELEKEIASIKGQ